MEIKIEGDYIRLDQLLKLAQFAGSGGHAKLIILDGLVKVNGQVVRQRGKKIRPGDRVSYGNMEVQLIE